MKLSEYCEVEYCEECGELSTSAIADLWQMEPIPIEIDGESVLHETCVVRSLHVFCDRHARESLMTIHPRTRKLPVK